MGLILTKSMVARTSRVGNEAMWHLQENKSVRGLKMMTCVSAKLFERDLDEICSYDESHKKIGLSGF